MTKTEFDIVTKVATKLIGTKMWGLHPQKGWSMPLIIEYNGEYYRLKEKVYREEKYFDYTEDIKNGVYEPTGIKVEEQVWKM